MEKTKRMDAQERIQRIERVLWAVLVLNLAVAGAKFSYGIATSSASMQADGIHSFFDSFGNVVALISINIARRPADEHHPYGHAKFETYGSLIIGVLLLLAAFEVGMGAVERLASGEYHVSVTPVSFAVMVGTLAVNGCVTYFERREGKRLGSEILSADAAHTLSDALVSIGVIVGLGFVAAGFPVADPIMALIVTVAILFSAVSVFKGALRVLADRAQLPAGKVAEAVAHVPGIVGVHRVRTRGTENEIYCDLHILVDPDMTVREAHKRAHEAERSVKAAFSGVKEVMVHMEPSDDGDEGLNQ